MRWCGWCWDGGAWRKVCQAESLAACARQLTAEGKRRGVPEVHQVLTGGGAPTFVPPPRGRPCRKERTT
jgi:hypothetical protein